MQQDTLLHKVHAQGNDFILIPEKLHQQFKHPDRIRWLAHRRFGIGCDQVFFIHLDSNKAHYSCDIFNQDGSQASFCLNGIYAATCFIQQHYPEVNKWSIEVNTHTYHAYTQKQLNIHIPNNHHLACQQIPAYQNMPSLPAHYVSVNNEHLLIDHKHSQGIALAQIGKQLQSHPGFPEGINVSYYQIVSQDTIRIQTYERGSGLTYSCGSAGLATSILHWTIHNTPTWTILHPGGQGQYRKHPNSISMQGQYYYVASFDCTNGQHPERFPAPLST